MKFAPHFIQEFFKGILSDGECEVFAQVATVFKGMPQVRTVHLRSLKEYETFGFNTNIRSTKWSALSDQPTLAGCYYNRYINKQYRWEGTVRLLEGSSDPDFLNRMWRSTRSDVRKAYWAEYEKLISAAKIQKEIDLDQTCPTFGTVVCVPERWDVYEMDQNDYSEDLRTICIYRDDDWHFKVVSTLDGIIL